VPLPPALRHIDNICTISTINYLDSNIHDYPDDDTVDDLYADGDHFAPTDQRWRPVALIAGIVFVLAVIATVVIINGGDSASTSATVVVPPSRSVTPSPRLKPALPPETVTTVTPPPKASQTPTAGPTNAPTVIPPPSAVPSVPPEVAARTFVYRVTGTKPLFDLVTVVYTDAQGAPQTDFNVSLPWSRTVVMNPGVQLRSVVATSLTGHLNCSIIDGAGQPVSMSTSNAMIATCSR
jgi:Mycobacterium membrane protein